MDLGMQVGTSGLDKVFTEGLGFHWLSCMVFYWSRGRYSYKNHLNAFGTL